MSQQRSAAEKEHADRVREMFATIARRYDLLNHLLSGNVDKRWRRLLADDIRDKVVPGRSRILDVACGTGDLSLALFESTKGQVTATDFCHPMLEIALSKFSGSRGRIELVESDALQLPFRDRYFDAVAIGFGLRNLAAVEDGLKELFRVLKPGGWLAVLEFSRPGTPVLSTIFQFYFTRVLPLLGRLISGSLNAYTYLPNSVQTFPDQKRLASLITQTGFEEVRYKNLTGGIAALHSARRPI